MKRLILICLLMFAAPVWAATIYVDSATGDDDDDGFTEGDAKATIQAGITAAGSGGIVWIKGGVDYVEAVTVTVASITLIGYTGTPTIEDGGLAVIDGDDSAIPISDSGTTGSLNWFFANIEVKNSSGDGFDLAAAKWSASRISMYNCYAHDNATHGVDVSSFNDGVFANCVFEDNGSAGLYMAGEYHRALFFRCIFVGNTGYGLDAGVASRHPFAVQCLFVANATGAIDIVPVQCVFDQNTADGLNLTQPSAVIDSIFTENGDYGLDSVSGVPSWSIGAVFGAGDKANTTGAYDYLTYEADEVTDADPQFADEYDSSTNPDWADWDYSPQLAALIDVARPIGLVSSGPSSYMEIGPMQLVQPDGAVYITAPGDLNPTALDEDTADQVAYVLLVDSGDNTTPETGISGPTITLSKAGGSFASPSDGTWTEIGNGLYSIGLDATDTSTAGVLITKVVAGGCADDYELLQVGSSTAPSASTVAAAVWDSGQQTAIRTRMTGSDTAVSVLTENSNIGIDLDDTTGTLDAAEIGDDAITAAKIAANAIGASEVAAGALVAGTEITGLSDSDDLVDDFWDEALSGHTTAGSSGKALADVESDATDILTDTNELQTDDTPGAFTSLASHGDSNWATATSVDLEDDAITAAKIAANAIGASEIADNAIDAGAIAADAIGASELAADAVTEIDTAMNAAIAELTTDPGATPTPRQILALMYMANRNRVDTTSDTLTYYNDAGEAVFTITLSDDGTTFTRAEMADAE